MMHSNNDNNKTGFQLWRVRPRWGNGSQIRIDGEQKYVSLFGKRGLPLFDLAALCIFV